MMDELKQRLVDSLQLDDEKANQVVDVVAGFLKERVPPQFHGMLENLEGEQGAQMAQQAASMLQGFLKQK